MRLLMIAAGYLPYTFSENLCIAKLVYAMLNNGWQVDVITRIDEGPAYSAEWTEPWLPLKDGCHEIRYNLDGKFNRIIDTILSSVKLRVLPEPGVRFASRACDLAIKLHKENKYDALLTRAPGDIVHLVGWKIKNILGIPWLANWNDPAAPIWPEPYKHSFSSREQEHKMKITEIYLRNADINTFPSQSLLNHFISYFPFLAKQKTAVIPHIAMLDEIVPWLKEVPITDKFRMCHSGNLSRERDPELTFRALRELIDEGFNKIQFSIMGHVNDYTNDLIKKYRLEQVVDCIGGFPYMQALEKMQEFDCLVLLEARLKRGIFFASKFTDYAQLGKPILAISPSEGFAVDMLKQYGGGISVDNEDYNEIKKGILKLYKAWEDKTLIVKYSTEKLYKQMSADTVIKKYLEILT